VAARQQPVPTIAAAVDTFLARSDLAASSRRSYAQTLSRLAADIGADRAVAVLDAGALNGVVHDAWGACAHIHETKGPRHRLSRVARWFDDPRLASANERTLRSTDDRISAAMHRAAYHDVPLWLTVGIQSAQRCTVGLASRV